MGHNFLHFGQIVDLVIHMTNIDPCDLQRHVTSTLIVDVDGGDFWATLENDRNFSGSRKFKGDRGGAGGGDKPWGCFVYAILGQYQWLV